MKTSNALKSRVLTLITVVVFSLSNMQCIVGNINSVKGNGKVTTTDRNVSTFNSIDVSGAFSLTIRQGEPQSVRVEADENLQDIIITKVDGGKLEIYNDKSISNPTKLNVYITCKDISEIESSGATNVNGETEIVSKSLHLDLSGASDLNLNIKVEKLHTELSGAGKICIKGTADEHIVDISGAGTLKAFELLTNKTNIEISGAGSAKINATEELDADLSGAGFVTYKSEPKSKIIRVSGVGSVKKED